MVTQLKIAPELASLLSRHHQEIAAAWAKNVQELPDSHYSQLSLTDINSGTSIALTAIIETLTTGTTQAIDAHLMQESITRLQSGYGIDEVIKGLLMMKEAALPYICADIPADCNLRYELITDLDVCFRYVIGQFSFLYAEAMTNHFRHQQKLTASMLDAAETLANSPNPDQTLQSLTEKIAGAFDMSSGIYLFDIGHGILVPQTRAGDSDKPRVKIFKTYPLDPAVDNFVKELLMQQRHVCIENADIDQQISRETVQILGIKSLMAVPIVTGSRLLGAAMVNTFDTYYRYKQEDIELMVGIANSVGMAIENARLHRQERKLAVIEERQRLARELHDSVTQTLYTVTLYADATRMALSAGKTEKANQNLQMLRDMAHEAMLEIRLLIYELHPLVLEKEGLVAAIQTRLAAVEARANVQTEFHVEGERRLPLAMEEDLYRIAQEILNNIVKHARATRVAINLILNQQVVTLEIHDDGSGFDPDTARQSGGLGLRSIKERVERLGGKLEILTAPLQGTTIKVIIYLRLRC